jgi:hypothetical protein
MEHLSTLLQIDLQNLYVPPKRQDRNSDISHTDSIPYNGSLPFTKKFLTREETFNRNPQYQSKSYLPHQEEKSTPKIDFDKVWHYFNDRENEFLYKALIYTIKNPESDSGRFETKLRQIGFDVITKNLPKTRKKENPYKLVSNSIILTIDCISSINFFDKLILMTNHGSYTDLCKFIRSKNKTVELWCFKNNYDPILEAHTDKLSFIDSDFILKKNISVFGFNLGIGDTLSLTDDKLVPPDEI